MSPFAADKKHLHHRLLKIGHSHRQSVLIMYLWAALFTGAVTSLSLVRTDLIVLVGLTLVAVLALLPVTMPRLRPTHWRQSARADRADRAARAGRAAASRTAASPGARPASRAPAPAVANTAVASAAPASTVPLNAGAPSHPDAVPVAPRERSPAAPAAPATPPG
jgi:UDP-GlcNAc:undecaprenyl-phosphate/decaprenyl-phosphate GlcNAc-1-phosphate transferase